MNNSLTTLKIPGLVKGEIGRQEQWEELRSLFPIYLALAKQLEFEIPFGPERRNLPAKADAELFDSVLTWVNSMDQRVMVHQLRHLLQMTTLNASESGLRALILRHLRKAIKSSIDRDKIDFLLVQYFALCAPAKIYHKQIDLADTAQVMFPVLGEVDSTPLSWCEPLEKVIDSLKTFRSVREILNTNFIEQGRRVKESAGGMFYDPSALLAFIRFNFLLRRTLIELMHADLIAIRTGLAQLEAGGIRFLDCEHAGLERCLEKIASKQTANQALHGALLPPTKAAPPARAPQAESLKASVRTEIPANLDFETCMEQIWEQLIAAPPSRGRSMTTIRLGAARVLLSSWEVSAFVSEDGPSAEDLRRAVVARALVAAATESTRETGNATNLDRALAVARLEVTRLLEQVDVAKQAKDTEAAVNMGISAKRLNSAIDEAEKL